ncbi:MAG: hypothetical protein JST92_27750, partial [Deltaproteobacteria bacterium]|nr:hypothetical protein [Deltaproteobacteria bacterium]
MTTRRQFLTHTALGFGSYLLLTEACTSHDAHEAAPAQPPAPRTPLPPLPKTG